MLDDKITEALKIAVSALYFDDNSDYETALYEIVTALAGTEASQLVFDNRAEAYEKFVRSVK